MSTDITTTPPTTSTSPSSESVKETARNVASRSAEEAKQLGGEALDGARQLVRTGRTEVRDQLQTQTVRAAGAARTAASQLLALANGDVDAAGRAQSLARDAGDRLQSLAEQLDREGVDGLARRASDFARRRPAVFLGGMALAGFFAGRYAKVLAQHDDSSSQPVAASMPAPSAVGMSPPAVGNGGLSAPLAQDPLASPTTWADR